MISAEPLITVIIPTFRRPQSLRRAVLSVLNQTFSEFQVYVCDDASNDITKEIVSKLAEADSRIKYYCHEQNIGAAANFNYGLKKVNTPFFSFLSDDDLLLPHFFEVAMQSLCSKPDAMFYAGLTIEVENNKITGVSKDGGRFGFLTPPDSILDLSNRALQWSSIIFRSEVINDVGLLDIEVGGPADMDFQFRIAARHPVVISAKPSAIYVLHAQNSYARSTDYRMWLQGFGLIINKMMSDECVSLGTRIQVTNKLNEWLANILIGLAEQAILKKKFNEASAIAGILMHSCNKKASASFLFSLSKLRESSEPAFFLISWIMGGLRFMFPPNILNKIKLKQLQRKYRACLCYLGT